MPIPQEDPSWRLPDGPTLVQRAVQTANDDIRVISRSRPFRVWLVGVVSFGGLAFGTNDIMAAFGALLIWISGSAWGALATRVR